MSIGIVVLAQNLEDVNYVKQAELLAMSLKVTNPKTKISIVTNDKVNFTNLFDKIIPIPWNDDAKFSSWKIENRWKIYHASPYDKTMVMDVDMLVLQDISTWWKFLEKYKLFFTSKVFTYRGDISDTSYYRKTFIANKLPNLFAGLHYFEKSDQALEFYKLLELVVQNWEAFYERFLEGVTRPKQPSIDVCASIVALILDCTDSITNELVDIPSFTHMKNKCQGWTDGSSNWQDKVGFYINIEYNVGYTALIGAIYYNQPEIAIKILNRDDVDVNLQDKNGSTALMFAITKKRNAIATKILKKPAINVKLKDNNGNTALMMANKMHQTENANEIRNKET